MSCLYFAALLRACIVMLVIKSVDLSKKKKKKKKRKKITIFMDHTQK